ncbi:uncharacterized protein LOC128882012 [Hylaeus volcanicus]|uniref:uncharacterized protein LOC128882012 n=1 Tax=Hylaeus volcanicus TaxID=313075 RepID=UPI0023B85209|nr:uncharacterized protein LOC128882012 [Hylaeus volcanicus]
MHCVNEAVKIEEVKYGKYADDIAIITQGKNNEQTTIRIEEGISQLGDFLKDRKLELSIDMTKTLFFGQQTPQSNIMELMMKTRKRLSIVNYLCHRERGIKQNQALMMARALITSVMEYGAAIYMNSRKQIYLQEELRKLESKAIRTAMGYRMSTPLNVMYPEAGWIGHKDRALFLACKYWIGQLEKGRDKKGQREHYKQPFEGSFQNTNIKM